MDKYLAIISNSIKRNLVYRANSFIMMFSILFSFGIIFYFWSSIYRQGNQVGQYSLNEIISYYFFVTIFELFFSSNVAWGIADEIKNGQITNNILKPISHLGYKFSQALGSILYRIFLFSPAVLVVLFLVKDILVSSNDKFGYVFFVLFAVLAFSLNFLIYYTVGILSFWIGDGFGFLFACYVAISFMQGQWIPLDLLPKWFLYISDYLPFKYLFFVPVAIVSGKIEVSFLILVVAFFWCVIFYLIAKFLYKKGIKKYEGYGA